MTGNAVPELLAHRPVAVVLGLAVVAPEQVAAEPQHPRWSPAPRGATAERSRCHPEAERPRRPRRIRAPTRCRRSMRCAARGSRATCANMSTAIAIAAASRAVPAVTAPVLAPRRPRRPSGATVRRASRRTPSPGRDAPAAPPDARRTGPAAAVERAAGRSPPNESSPSNPVCQARTTSASRSAVHQRRRAGRSRREESAERGEPSGPLRVAFRDLLQRPRPLAIVGAGALGEDDADHTVTDARAPASRSAPSSAAPSEACRSRKWFGTRRPTMSRHGSPSSSRLST